jgi:hypothetical protein
VKNAKNKKRARPEPSRSSRAAKRERVFDSLAAAAAALNLDTQTLKRAKGAGCPAFVGSRVQEKEFLRWISDNPDKLAAPAGATLEDQKTAEQVRKLRIGNDREDGALILVATVEKLLHEIAAGQLKILRQRLENEYPTAVSGMDPAQARVYGKRLVDEICAQMCDLVKKWKD